MRISRKRIAARSESPAEGSVPLYRLLLRDFQSGDHEPSDGAFSVRGRSLAYAPAFLGAVHLACGGVILASNGGGAIAIAALAALLTLDLILCLAARRRAHRLVAPNRIAQAAALYAVAATILWSALAFPALSSGQSSHLLGAAVAAGFLALPVILLAFPSVLAIAGVAGLAAMAVLTHDPPAVAVAGGAFLGLLHFSLRSFAASLARARKQAELEWSAQRASRFVDEFEQSGRGWFWETTTDGLLSYVSEQLARELRRPAAELIGIKFSDLVGADVQRADSSDRTLGFHLSARLALHRHPRPPRR